MIEITNYEKWRLEYFKDLLRKAERKYEKENKKYMNEEYTYRVHCILSNLGAEIQYLQDVVEMLKGTNDEKI